jgi:four helix bundle protein
MAKIESFRELETWQRGMDVAVAAYRLTRSFPAEERYGLTAQIRRAAVSIPSDVAEGFNRRSEGGYLNHVAIALGSLAELDSQFELAERVGLLQAAERAGIQMVISSAGQLLHGLARSLDRRPGPADRPSTESRLRR